MLVEGDMDGILVIVSMVIAWLGARWLWRFLPKHWKSLDQHFPLDSLTKDILEYLTAKEVVTTEEILLHLNELGYSHPTSKWELMAKLWDLYTHEYIDFAEDFDEWQLLAWGYEALEENARILRRVAVETGLAPQEFPSPEGLMD